MKLRNGYVSNSSSSSFIILTKDSKNKPDGYFSMLDMLKVKYPSYFDLKNKGCTVIPVKEYIDSLNGKLENSKELKTLAEKDLTLFKSIKEENFELASSIINVFIHPHNGLGRSKVNGDDLGVYDFPMEFNTPERIISSRIYRLEQCIKDQDKLIKETEKKVEIVSKHSEEDYYVIEFVTGFDDKTEIKELIAQSGSDSLELKTN